MTVCMQCGVIPLSALEMICGLLLPMLYGTWCTCDQSEGEGATIHAVVVGLAELAPLASAHSTVSSRYSSSPTSSRYCSRLRKRTCSSTCLSAVSSST